MMFLPRTVEEGKVRRNQKATRCAYYHGSRRHNLKYIVERWRFYDLSNSSSRNESCDFQMKSAEVQSNRKVQVYVERKSKFLSSKNSNQIPNEKVQRGSKIKGEDVAEIKEIIEMYVGPGVLGRRG